MVEFGGRGWFVSSVRQLSQQAFVEGFAVESDAVALLVKSIRVGIGRPLVTVGRVLHLEPVAEVGCSACGSGCQLS